jgi:hypothetical protein
MQILPQSRSNEIVVRDLNEEVLIYDLVTNKSYCLNKTAAIVYNSCDGKTSFDELKKKHKLTDDIIYLALDELMKDNLIETDASFGSSFSGVSRRDLIKKIGLTSMIALPVISSIVAPTAAHAQSGCIQNGQPSATTSIPNQLPCEDGFPDSSCCAGTAYGAYNGPTNTCVLITCGPSPFVGP